MTSKLERAQGGIIYLIECLATGEWYVGKTQQPLYRRWAEHRYEMKVGRKLTPLYAAMREHGCEKFRCHVIAWATNGRELAELEEWWTARLQTREKGLNRRIGGGGVTEKLKGRRAAWDEGTKQRISESLRATAERKRAARATRGLGSTS